MIDIKDKVAFSLECDCCAMCVMAEIDPKEDLQEQFDVFVEDSETLGWTIDDDEIYCVNCKEEDDEQ